jgi:hypothetical protein
VAVGETFFSLRDLAFAVDEWGKELKVRVKDDGGFDVNVPGVYTVVFRAEHPVTDEDYTAECTVTVEEAPEPEPTSTLTGTSDSRYRKYLKYRDEVASQLQCIMQELNEEFRKRIDLLRGAFSDASTFEMLREVPSAEDTDTAQQLSEDQMTLQAMDTIAVANWSHVLATFVAESSLDVDDPLDLFNLRKIPSRVSARYFGTCTSSNSMWRTGFSKSYCRSVPARIWSPCTIWTRTGRPGSTNSCSRSFSDCSRR